MIHYHIHNDLDALVPGLAGKFFVFRICSETRIDFIKISRGITMVGSFGLIVLQDRIQPDSGELSPGVNSGSVPGILP